MTRERVLALLGQVADGSITAQDALRHLSMAPFETTDFATIDHHRGLRQGYPEVIYADGKTPEQVVGIAERIAAQGSGFLATRTSSDARRALAERFGEAHVNETARTVWVRADSDLHGLQTKETVLVVSAGTSDEPVAEEAAETGHAIGLQVERLRDVGVAGLHRLLARGDALTTAGVIIVVAGMDGALPSVVGGLVAAPVIAVPTSIGYGASLGGLTALFTMLTSCAAGVTVVNIDNGFGAAMAAARIVRQAGR